MNLAAVMDLVLEEMQQHSVGAFHLDVVRARNADLGGQRIRVETSTVVYQPVVGGALLAGKVGKQRKRDFRLEGCGAETVPFERADIEPVDGQDMVQRVDDGGKEADARR